MFVSIFVFIFMFVCMFVRAYARRSRPRSCPCLHARALAFASFHLCVRARMCLLPFAFAFPLEFVFMFVFTFVLALCWRSSLRYVPVPLICRVDWSLTPPHKIRTSHWGWRNMQAYLKTTHWLGCRTHIEYIGVVIPSPQGDMLSRRSLLASTAVPKSRVGRRRKRGVDPALHRAMDRIVAPGV